MTDLSNLPTDQLTAILAGAMTPMPTPAPKPDLSSIPTEKLKAMVAGAPAPSTFAERYVATPLASAASNIWGTPRALFDLAGAGGAALAKATGGEGYQEPGSEPGAGDPAVTAETVAKGETANPLPSAAGTHAWIQSQADKVGINASATPESRFGKIMQSAITGALTGAAMPIGGLWTAVLSGTAGGAGQEVAGQATEGTKLEPYARFAGGLIAGGLPIIGRALMTSAAGSTLRDAVGNLTPQQAAQAEQILRDSNGTVTALQAIQQVTGPNPKLGTIQSIVERNAAPGSPINQMTAQLPARNNAMFDAVVGNAANPENIPGRVQDAATAALNATPEAQAVTAAQAAAGPRTTPEMAGAAIRPPLAADQAALEARRSAQAAADYGAARAGGETINTDPVLQLVNDKLATTKGATRSAIEQARGNLFVGTAPDTSVAGLIEADREIGDQISAAARAGNNNTAHHLTEIQTALRQQLDAAPMAGQARQNFAANSQPLQPFETGAVGSALERDQFNARYLQPVEKIAPSLLKGGPTEVDNFLTATANQPGAREAFGNYVSTTARDFASDANGALDPTKLRNWLTKNSDVMDRLPDVRARLENVAIAQEGRNALDETLTGQLAATRDLKTQANLLLDPQAATLTPGQIRQTVSQLQMQDPRAATDLVNRALRIRFNEANQDLSAGGSALTESGGNTFGGAKFRAQIMGNRDQAENLQALITSLPNGEARWSAFNRLMDVFQAQGMRMPMGSNTAYAAQALQDLKQGRLGGMVNAVSRGAWKSLSDWAEKSNLSRATDQIAEAITASDLGPLRQLTLANPNSERAAGLALRALGVAHQQ